MPPQLSPESSPVHTNAAAQFSPPETDFSPLLPKETLLMSQRLQSPIAQSLRSPTPAKFEDEMYPSAADFDDFENGAGMQSVVEVNRELLKESDSEDEDEVLVPEIDTALALQQLGNKEIVVLEPATRSTPSVLTRIFYLLVSLAILAFTINYKLESETLGYCDTGTNTNKALETLQARRLAVEQCREASSMYLYPGKEGQGEPLCPPPTGPLPLPDSCTPCPAHASCTQDTMVCDKGYLLTSHPLLRFFRVSPQSVRPTANSTWPVSNDPDTVTSWLVSTLTDGLPGLGSVALPPYCRRDRAHVRHLDFISSAVSQTLKDHRGQLLCDGGARPSYADRDGGEARQWGLGLDELKNKAYEVQLQKMKKGKVSETVCFALPLKVSLIHV
jgi:hypothetical protein